MISKYVEIPKDWHIETDVVILGCGYAGACAAIYARDNGVNDVIIIEKMPHLGGVSVFSAGLICGGSDYEGFVRYLEALCSGRTPRDVIEAQAKGWTEVFDDVRGLCKINGATFEVVHKFKDPSKATGSGEMSESEYLSAASYPISGGENLRVGLVTKVPGFNGYSWLRSNWPGGLLMKVLEENLKSRNVGIHFNTPGKELIQDGIGNVIGLRACKEGMEINIKARLGVVIATGGFESNEWMKLQFCEAKPIYSMSPSNTGDGIIMAQKVGAALWHMWHLHGSYGFKFPEFRVAFRHILGSHRNPKRRVPWILVDKIKGRRFMNEYHPAPQDTGYRPLQYFDPDIQDFPRIPCWLVFDEKGRKMGPLAHTLTAYEEDHYDWSPDNSKEIEKGWILKAGCLAELAEKMNVNIANFQKAVGEWNENVQNKEDKDFGRPAGTMVSIEKPPYYAVKVWPIVSNTQGGPEHNAKQQVLDAFRKPIPHLYSAGECGSIYGHLYQLTANIAECIISGRIVGENIAKEMPLA